MSTTPLTDAITALTTYSNTVTGASDTDLSSAVATLAAGYGQGDDTLINKLVSGQMGTDSYTFTATSLGRCFSKSTGQFSLSLPNCTTINTDFTFQDSEIVSISMPVCTNIGARTFLDCKKLVSVDIPNVTGLTQETFRNCILLTNIKLVSINGGNYGYSFSGCTSLTCAVLGNIGKGYRLFDNCTALTTVDITGADRLDNIWQVGCGNFDTLILREDASVIPLYNTTCFASTPFASGGTGGTIYVPSSLISSYQSASNWSTVDGYGTITWTAIEGSQYENYYADGTAISS